MCRCSQARSQRPAPSRAGGASLERWGHRLRRASSRGEESDLLAMLGKAAGVEAGAFAGNHALQTLLARRGAPDPGQMQPRCSCGGRCAACRARQAQEDPTRRTLSSPRKPLGQGREERDEDEAAQPIRSATPARYGAAEGADPTAMAPHADDATIVCDGSGGYRPDLRGWTGAKCGMEACVRLHEESHAADWRARWPDGCKNDDGTPKPDGSQIPLGGWGYSSFLRESECKANTVDLQCEQDLVKNASAECKPYVEGIAKDTAAEKAKYCGGC